MRVRRPIFWMHLVFGVLAGVIVLVMSLTGVALTYQKQITSWADKRACTIQVSGTSQISPELLLRNLQKVRPGTTPTNLTFSSDPEMPVLIALGPAELLFADPYNGQILGSGAHGVRTFFRIMTDWHRWLGMSGEKRGLGRAITGAGNVVFLVLAITGLYLWWPQKWTSGVLRALAWFRFGLTTKARDSNWHNVFGVWCLIPLIIIIASGVVISYSWASNLVFQIAGQKPPASGLRRPGMPPARSGPRPAMQIEGLDALFNAVEKYSADWKTIGIQPPSVADRTVVFTVDAGSGGQPQLRSTLTLDKDSGRAVRSENFESMGPGMKARLWMRFAHTGEYYGFLGQTIAGIASLAGVVLVWTGLALTFRRYVAAVRRRAKG